MIYTRFGNQVKFLTKHGEHQPEGFLTPLHLVKCKFEDGTIRFRFIEFLKADNGIAEIEQAYKDTKYQNLTQETLDSAIKQAM